MLLWLGTMGSLAGKWAADNGRNDVYREAAALGVDVTGVRVVSAGEFDDGWTSTGVTYSVELDSAASADALAGVLDVVDKVAEIPRAMRAGAPVQRVG
jgi:hypothetical protein